MGDNAIHYTGHVKMMAAVQPFLSGAISKTVNMPEEATVEDIEQIHIDAWKMGLKAVAIYRDNCKVAQPLSMAKKGGNANNEVADTSPAVAGVAGVALGPSVPAVPGATGPAVAGAVQAAAPVAAANSLTDRMLVKGAIRRELPKSRNAKTIAFKVAGSKGYVTIGEFEDGSPGEVFMKIAKQGSTLAGVMDALAISVSYGLQYGVPLKSYVHGLTNMSFAPAGITDDVDIRTASSLVDYIFRRLALTYLSFDDRLELGLASIDDMPDFQTSLTSLLGDGDVLLTEEPVSPAEVLSSASDALPSQPVIPEAPTPIPAVSSTSPAFQVPSQSASSAASVSPPASISSTTSSASSQQAPATTKAVKKDDTAPMCYNCGNQTQRAGSCYVCTSCGSTTGCS
jgi:ribonucleoside-diphosphate reductase alpha chain